MPTSSGIDAALAYAAQGWRVFPCQLNGKIPLTPHGFKDATQDPDTIRHLFSQPCNLGLVTGHGRCVLDIDVREGKHGDETLHDLEAKYGALPATYSVKTWSGGQHYYFTCPIPTKSKNGLFPGIDLKAEGGYVIAPPSQIDGKAYVPDVDAPLATLPAWLLAPAPKPIAKGMRNVSLTSIGGKLRRAGIEEPVIAATLAALNVTLPEPLPSPEVQTIAHSVSQYPPAPWASYGVAVTQQKTPICNAATVLAILEQHPQFRDSIWFDSFRQRIRTTWESALPRDWHDADSARLLVFLQRELELHKLARSSVEEALQVYLMRHTKHEVQDWLKTLTWDGTSRIDTWLPVLLGTDDTTYTRAASRNFWLSLAARIWIPGCQVDHMVVLEGPQGQGKTSALRIIGGAWYLSMMASVVDKDFFQVLPGHLIVEISELESFYGAASTRIKQAITTMSDTFRPSYGKHSKTFHRQCVFVGTTNEDKYLKDRTGARRFWPVRCGTVDLLALKAQRDQLFAEAHTIFKKGATWWDMPLEAPAEQEARREEDVWETSIAEYLLLHEEVRLLDVLTDAVHIAVGQIGMVEQRRAAAILRKFGWTNEVFWRGNMTVRRWKAPPRTAGEDLTSQDFTV